MRYFGFVVAALVLLPSVTYADIHKADKPETEIFQTAQAEAPFVVSVAKIESNMGEHTKAATGSAKGVFQFLPSTWNKLVAKYGAETGITRKDISNPHAQIVMVSLLARDNRDVLKATLGRKITSTDLYAAHFLGINDAIKFLQAYDKGSKQPAATILPNAAQANPKIFYDQNRPIKIKELYVVLEKMLKR